MFLRSPESKPIHQSSDKLLLQAADSRTGSLGTGSFHPRPSPNETDYDEVGASSPASFRLRDDPARPPLANSAHPTPENLQFQHQNTLDSGLASGLHRFIPGTPMNFECCNTLVLDEPSDQARRRILAALKEHGLRVEFDFDVASSIQRSSGVKLARCSVLGVGCPYQLLEAFVADGAAAAFFPLHVAIAEHGRQTLVRTLAPHVLRSAGVAPAIAIPVYRTLRRIRESVDAIEIRTVSRGFDDASHLDHEVADEVLQTEVKGS